MYSFFCKKIFVENVQCAILRENECLFTDVNSFHQMTAFRRNISPLNDRAVGGLDLTGVVASCVSVSPFSNNVSINFGSD